MKMVHKYIRQEFNDVDEYIKHFDKINSDDTSCYSERWYTI
jgi:hypothetical protein